MFSVNSKFLFPIFSTKIEGLSSNFDLSDPTERARYFQAKAGPEIEKLRDFLRASTFIAFLIGKKNSGKGTYSKLFAEAIGQDKIAHISVGDIVRRVHSDFADAQKKQSLLDYLKFNYRGFIDVEAGLSALLGRNTSTLLPTEMILALVRREIDQLERKALFIDGFPRNLDQVSYSLYFRELIGYRDDPDFFAFIDVPSAVIDERMQTRVVCPSCQTTRSLRLARTKEIGYDLENKTFYLICDNKECNKARMVSKEGDELGVEAIRERIEADDNVARTLMGLQGVPKVYLRNSIPVSSADEYVDKYEITPAYRYEWDEAQKAVRVIEEPWVVNDDALVPSYSLLPAPVSLSLIKQTSQVLGL